MILVILYVTYLALMLFVVVRKQDMSIGNFVWGGGCFLLAISTFWTSLFLARQILVTSIISIWFMRLASYVYARYRKGSDPRFTGWIHLPLLLNAVWIALNGAFGVLMAYPALLVNRSVQIPTLTVLDYIGLTVWIFGFIIEATADYQLNTFKKNPTNAGHIMKSGLWYYSRHPNYFGEIVMWWGIFIIACSVPLGWTTIITPMAITTTLLWITGIPLAERSLQHYPEYQDYKRRTSMLIIWIPKK